VTNGLFSVSATKKVYFSKGNLQLVGENTFQFAENQWDYFGSNQSDNHRDLFCWGAGNNPNLTTGNSTFTDWGDNTYLQATLGKGWRTMTKDEFVYVFNTRASGSSVFGIADGRYTMATINTDGTGVKGLILFPDGITIEASEVTTAGAINGNGTMTQCTTAQWAALAKKGCVFLPAGGYFLPANGAGAGYGDITDYWTSTAADASNAYNLGLNFAFPGAIVNTAGTLGYKYGCSVRLVIDSSAIYSVALNDGSDNPTTWTGKVGEATTFSALPLEGVAEGQTVTLQYNGRLKVKGVKATSDAAPAAGNSVDLSTLTADYEAQDGDVLTGTLNGAQKITIADGATVTLDGVTISNGQIACEGSVTMILMGANTVTATDNNAAIKIGGPGTTLTITGSGSLTAQGGLEAAGIGTDRIEDDELSFGNIVINGGTVTATGGKEGAGIGTGLAQGEFYTTSITCGDITINGGTVTATGGDYGPGIGTGVFLKYGSESASNRCGNITIGAGVTSVTATKGGSYSPNSIGKGYAQGGTQNYGTITIGGTVYATGVTTSPFTYTPSN
jgi:hypothetical protein